MDSKQPLNDIKWLRIKHPGFPHFNPKRWRHRHASRAMAPPGRGHGRCAVRDAQRHRLRGQDGRRACSWCSWWLIRYMGHVVISIGEFLVAIKEISWLIWVATIIGWYERKKIVINIDSLGQYRQLANYLCFHPNDPIVGWFQNWRLI